MEQIRLGTRGSRLALLQAQWVKDKLEERCRSVRVEIVTIKTKGDNAHDRPSGGGGDTGLFTRGIEEALLRDEVNIAVHSLKDLPTVQPAGLVLAAVTERLDPHDALVSRARATLALLETGMTIGTSSVRRKAQLLSMNRDINVVDLRGNLDTRLRRVLNGEFDAIVVARAGLIRMQRDDVETACLPFDKMLPAAGQGALAIEARQDAAGIREIVSELNHEESALTTLAERKVLRRLGAGCHVPVGVLAEPMGDGGVRLRCAVLSKDGRAVVQASSVGPDAAYVVDKVVQQLADQGASRLIEDAEGGQ